MTLLSFDKSLLKMYIMYLFIFDLDEHLGDQLIIIRKSLRRPFFLAAPWGHRYTTDNPNQNLSFVCINKR